MKRYRDENYSIEIFFVFAEIDVMTRRAKQREKETGRQTDIEHVRACFPYHRLSTDFEGLNRSDGQPKLRLKAFVNWLQPCMFIEYG
jgi:hypothetical protein